MFQVKGSLLQPSGQCFLEVFCLMLFGVGQQWKYKSLRMKAFFQRCLTGMMANWIFRRWCILLCFLSLINCLKDDFWNVKGHNSKDFEFFEGLCSFFVAAVQSSTEYSF